MTLPDASATSGQDSRLLDSWRAASLAAGWLHPGDWHCPAVEVMAYAVAAGDGVEAAAGLLGGDRAARGVGLSEGLSDLESLFGVASGDEPPFAVTRAFAQSWSEAATGALLDRGSIDALTGLATQDYLITRLREVYAEQRATGVPARDTWCLIRIEAPGQSGWEGMAERASRARVVAGVLDQGESNAVLASGAIVSLARTATAAEHAIRLRRRLTEWGDEAPEVGVTRLPDTTDEALDSLRGL